MGGDGYYQKVKDRFTATGVGTNAGVTVASTAATGKVQTVVGIQCSGDAAAIVTIESPASTVLWRKRFAAAFNFSDRFDPGVLKGAPGDIVQVKISASTSNCEANLNGFTLA